MPKAAAPKDPFSVKAFSDIKNENGGFNTKMIMESLCRGYNNVPDEAVQKREPAFLRMTRYESYAMTALTTIQNYPERLRNHLNTIQSNLAILGSAKDRSAQQTAQHLTPKFSLDEPNLKERINQQDSIAQSIKGFFNVMHEQFIKVNKAMEEGLPWSKVKGLFSDLTNKINAFEIETNKFKKSAEALENRILPFVKETQASVTRLKVNLPATPGPSQTHKLE